jgi:hypothetical protein
MWGSDSSSPEAWLGVTIQTRELVGDILRHRVRQKEMSALSAMEFARDALCENARGFYRLP